MNGKDYVLDPEDCAICDEAGVQSIAGVIGSLLVDRASIIPPKQYLRT